ncbi:hypothetical protein ACO0LB_16440 [Undibacterium sp. SXout7W]|uniref:hypothetical protein n=1 Tax=Undibacterium sp. SXout7W TaxID=3413049 RepID=UPI003BF15BE7
MTAPRTSKHFTALAAHNRAARRNYKPEIKPATIEALPFVVRLKKGKKLHNNWAVTPTNDYGLACFLGAEYAAHFAQYLQDNPGTVGMNLLGHIVTDIDFNDATATKGYWVGFFSHLERLIFATARQIDVFADVDRVHANTAAILAAREQEAQEDRKANHV